jgi:hypothetical protein
LSFPDYFGRNWNALLDCLSDLTWSTAHEVVIDHAALPRLPTRERRIYLEVLLDAVARLADRRPKLRPVFRTKDRQAIVAALASRR